MMWITQNYEKWEANMKNLNLRPLSLNSIMCEIWALQMIDIVWIIYLVKPPCEGLVINPNQSSYAE